MSRFKKTRSLLLAVTALTVVSTPALAEGPNDLQEIISGITQPVQGVSAARRSGITTSVGQSLQDPVAASPTEFSTVGDNLGNHTAINDLNLNGNDLFLEGGDVIAGGGRVLGIAVTPSDNAEATSKLYVDSLGQDLTNAITVIEGDVQTLFDRRINTPLNQGLTGGGPLSSDLTLTVDGTVVRTSGNQVISGLKTFSAPISLDANRLLGVAEPIELTDGVNKGYVDKLGETLGGEIDELTETFLTRRIDTGTGLLGGGNLSQNLVLRFDTSWGDTRYALRDRNLSAGDGLTGGGDLSGDRSFSVDASVVRTTGNQIIGGNKTFTGLLAFSNGRLTSVGTPVVASDAATKGYVDGVADQIGVDIDTLFARRINTGTGLSGGGDLTQDRTLLFDTNWGDARYALASRTLTAGDGLTGGGTLAGNRSFSVDESVVRTSGAQTIAGAKTFRQGGGTLFERAAGQDGVLLRGRAGGVDGFSVTITPGPLTANRVLTLADGGTTLVPGTMVPTSRSVLSGDGLTGGGTLGANLTLSVDGTVVRTAGAQTIAGNKTFTGSLSFALNRLTSVGTPVEASDAATKGYVDGEISSIETGIADLSARRIDTGTGLTGGGDLSADRTLSFDTTWGDARYALASRTMTAGDGLTGGGTLAGNRNFAVDGTVVRTTRSLSAGTGLTGGGDLSLNRSFSFDTAWGDARYAEHVTAGFSNAVTYDDMFGVTGNGAATFGHSSAGRPSDAPVAAQASGIHIGNTWGRSQMVFPNTANRIFFRNGTQSAWSEVWHSGNLDVTDLTPITRAVNTGTGLTGGGPLSSDRTLAFDMSWGDARYALASRTMTAGDGLTGGGTLAGNRNFAVDATVLRTTRSVNSGTGLTGGGALSIDRTLSFDTAWGDARYALASRTMTAGDGLTGGGTLAGNRNFAVDATVVRTAGAQTIAGAKTFTASPNFSNLRVLGVATPTAGSDAANKAYVDAAVSGAAGTTYTAGTGLTLSGGTFSVTNLAAGSATQGALRYNGTTKVAGQLYGGSTNPTATTRLNFDGSLYATRFYATQYFYFSDETLKENINPIGASEGMGIMRSIRPVRYDWRENGREALGVIAQETAEILPNLVDTNDAGLMSVDYIQLIAPMIAAIQDLDARVAELEGRND